MTRPELIARIANTLNDPRAGTAVFLCALLLAGAIGAAAVPGKRPALKSDRLTAAEEWAARRVAEERAAVPDEEGEVATFAERWEGVMGTEIDAEDAAIAEKLAAAGAVLAGGTIAVEGVAAPKQIAARIEREPEPDPPRQRRKREAREARDLCDRHGLRKTWVSRSRWRCR